jgi:hypothetical protein
MKKTLLALLAVAALVGCTKDNVLDDNKEAIGFSNAFIENSVKSASDPSLTVETLSDFAVYGFVEGATLFDGTTVNKTITNDQLTSEWKYEGTQYWIAGAKYDFHAVAPKTNGGWTKTSATKDTITLNFVNSIIDNKSIDLLYASASQEGKVSGNSAVAFTFNHALSKVKFSFANQYNASNAKIEITNIEITNAHKTATVTLNANSISWSDHKDNLSLSFGDASDNEATNEKENGAVPFEFGKTYESEHERLLITGLETSYEVEFWATIFINGSEVKTYYHNTTVKFKPEAGKSYDIKAVITPENIDPNHTQEPIQFTVNTLPGWGDTNDKNVN